MGNNTSVKAETMAPQHFEPLGIPSKTVRASMRTKTPMPADPNELERRFTKVLVSF